MIETITSNITINKNGSSIRIEDCTNAYKELYAYASKYIFSGDVSIAYEMSILEQIMKHSEEFIRLLLNAKKGIE